jgi:hypothetical protein
MSRLRWYRIALVIFGFAVLSTLTISANLLTGSGGGTGICAGTGADTDYAIKEKSNSIILRILSAVITGPHDHWCSGSGIGTGFGAGTDTDAPKINKSDNSISQISGSKVICPFDKYDSGSELCGYGSSGVNTNIYLTLKSKVCNVTKITFSLCTGMTSQTGLPDYPESEEEGSTLQPNSTEVEELLCVDPEDMDTEEDRAPGTGTGTTTDNNTGATTADTSTGTDNGTQTSAATVTAALQAPPHTG